MAMRSYYGVVHKDPDSAFGIWFPDLPGCFAASDSLDALVREVGDAVGLYLDGAEVVPEPSSLEAVRANAAHDLADGAFLVLVPHIAITGVVERVNISLDPARLPRSMPPQAPGN